MQIDESKGGILLRSTYYKGDTTVEGGGHHLMLQGTAAVIQRKMDQDGLTPVDFWIGPVEPFEETRGGEHVKGVKRESRVVLRAGRSDKTFAEWLMGSMLNKKPEGV